MVSLLPRLQAVGVEAILRASGPEGPKFSKGKDFVSEYSELISFAASGGNRDLELGSRIRSVVEKNARDSGWPDDGSAEARSRFDKTVARELALIPELNTAEALRDDVWAFITTLLVPEIVSWRFSPGAIDRFRGGVRNAVQRLWIRGVTLDRGEAYENRWGLLEELTEDALVQIFERASIAGDRRLSRAIAEVWVVTAGRLGRGRMEGVMRSAIKLLRLRNEIVDLAYLSDDELWAEIARLFLDAEKISHAE